MMPSQETVIAGLGHAVIASAIALTLALAIHGGRVIVSPPQAPKISSFEVLSQGEAAKCATLDPCEKCCLHGSPLVCGHLDGGTGLCVYRVPK